MCIREMQMSMHIVQARGHPLDHRRTTSYALLFALLCVSGRPFRTVIGNEVTLVILAIIFGVVLVHLRCGPDAPLIVSMWHSYVYFSCRRLCPVYFPSLHCRDSFYLCLSRGRLRSSSPICALPSR